MEGVNQTPAGDPHSNNQQPGEANKAHTRKADRPKVEDPAKRIKRGGNSAHSTEAIRPPYNAHAPAVKKVDTPQNNTDFQNTLNALTETIFKELNSSRAELFAAMQKQNPHFKTNVNTFVQRVLKDVLKATRANIQLAKAKHEGSIVTTVQMEQSASKFIRKRINKETKNLDSNHIFKKLKKLFLLEIKKAVHGHIRSSFSSGH